MLAVGRAVRARMVGRDVSRAFRARPHLYGHAHLLSEAGLLCPDRRCAVSGFSRLAAIYGSRSAWRTVCGACLWLYGAGCNRHMGRALSGLRSEEHTSELQSLMRISYAVFCLKKKKNNTKTNRHLISTITCAVRDEYIIEQVN